MYLYRYQIYTLYIWLAAGGAWEQFEVHLQMMIEWTQRCNWRPWSCEIGVTLGGRDWVNSGMRMETIIEWLWRWTWRPRLSELRDALGGRNQVIWWCTWRLWSSKLGGCDRGSWRCTLRSGSSDFGDRPRLGELRDAIGGCDWESFEMHLEAVIEWTQRCNWRL